MTPAQRLCNEAGLELDDVCRRAQLSPQRLKEYIRHGAPYVAQVRLGNVFGDRIKNHLVFIVGYERAKEVERDRESGDTSSAAGGTTNNARRRQRPDSILTLVD